MSTESDTPVVEHEQESTPTKPSAVPEPRGPGDLPRQAQLPFAVIDGQPMMQLPEDLYIPPDALEVFLEAFEGPLDLLLYLCRCVRVVGFHQPQLYP